jgi:hypothetical protein
LTAGEAIRAPKDIVLSVSVSASRNALPQRQNSLPEIPGQPAPGCDKKAARAECRI